MDQLEAFLLLVSTEENRKQYLEASSLIEELGIMSHYDDINLIITDSDDMDNGSIQLEIYNTLTRYLSSIAKKFTVIFSEDAKIELMVKVINALHVLPNYGDLDTIENTLQDEQLPNFALAEIISTIENVTWEEVIGVIDNVDESIILRAREIVESQIDPYQEEINKLYIERFKTFKEVNDITLYKEVLKEGIKVGSPLTLIIDQVSEELFESIKYPDLFAKEVLGLVLLSNEEESIKLTVSHLAEEFTDDLNIISKVNKAVIELEV